MDDKSLIKTLGGPAKVARLLGYVPNKGGTQRVQNWLSRGIPFEVKVKHRDIFLCETEKKGAEQWAYLRGTEKKEAA
jgi:hypothetical protein